MPLVVRASGPTAFFYHRSRVELEAWTRKHRLKVVRILTVQRGAVAEVRKTSQARHLARKLFEISWREIFHTPVQDLAQDLVHRVTPPGVLP